MVLGSIISGIGNVLGGLFGQSSQEDSVQAQMDFQERAMKHGIRWRVRDAQESGIHPLYALGAQTHMPSPVGIGGSPLAEGIAAAGQDIGRAFEAGSSGVQRRFASQMMALQLQRGQLENQVLASQLQRMNSPSQLAPSAVPERGLIAGQVQSAPSVSPTAFGGPPNVVNVPLERIVPAMGAPESEPGEITDVGWARTRTGWAPVPSQDVKNRIEDQLVPELGWAARNVVAPVVTQTGHPPFRPAPGHVWVNNGMEWIQVRASGTPESSYDYLR